MDALTGLPQATLLRDTYALVSSEPRIQKVFWFLLRDMKKDLLGPEGTMGLFKLNGVPKPALEAFRLKQPPSTPPPK